jgi:hypothetical protein
VSIRVCVWVGQSVSQSVSPPLPPLKGEKGRGRHGP